MPFPFLTQKISIKGEIVLRTGLHIGGGDVGLAIGGIDKMVVRSPKDNAPFVPGSSLKGKMRSLLERAGYAAGFEVTKNHQGRFEAPPCKCARKGCCVCEVFGVSAAQNEARDCGTTRLLVRDGQLLNADEVRGWKNLYTEYTETKTEVSIDRLTSQANPRTFERVPAGARFELDLVLNVHEGDDEDKNLRMLLDGLELLSFDYLGGQGSRGYGAVRVKVTELRKLSLSSLKDDSGAAWTEYSAPGRTFPWTTPRED